MLYLPFAGVRWPSVETRCARTLSNAMLIVSFFPRSVKTSCQSQVVPPSNNPCPSFKKTQPKSGFFPEKKCPSTSQWEEPMSAGWGVRVFLCLRVDGDDFTSTASHQKDPVQALEENFKELHVVLVSSSVLGWSWHVEQNQVSSL